MKNVSRHNSVPIKKLLLIMGILFLLITFYTIDRSRVENDDYPLFAMNVKILDDGASRYYVGVGYGAIAWKIPATRNNGGLLQHGFNVGKEIVGFPECYAALVSDDLSPGIRLEFVESDR
ncbi:MAG: hypothetical protein RBT62_07750 [Spirochaetia bacterium]|nr:hypothetical protein [Spirochaetia bacterium]